MVLKHFDKDLGNTNLEPVVKACLADEIVIHLAPILLGKGVRLFDHLGAEAIELERTAAVSTTGMTSLRFRVMKLKRSNTYEKNSNV
jgi:riboflavin biosynthesis pyrimidine reductase